MTGSTLIDIDWADLEYRLRLEWALVHFDDCCCEGGDAQNCNTKIDKMVESALTVLRKTFED